jgi:hypothetical protein
MQIAALLPWRDIMPIWPVDPASNSSITLVRWRIFETDIGERHFVGFNITDGEGRVSSAIEQFDADARSGVTRSGRIYRLEGPAGRDADALYTWNLWCIANNVKHWDDVTTHLTGETEPDGRPYRAPH